MMLTVRKVSDVFSASFLKNRFYILGEHYRVNQQTGELILQFVIILFFIFIIYVYDKALSSYKYMLALAGQTTGPNGLIFLREPSSSPGGKKFEILLSSKILIFFQQFFFFQNSILKMSQERWAFQLVFI